MATYSKYSATLTILSGNNAPFCYTYPDTVSAHLSKLRVVTIYNTLEEPYAYTFYNYGITGSTFPTGSTMSTSLTSFDSATGTATVSVSISIAAFDDGGNHFNGFTQTISDNIFVVYQNHFLSIAYNSGATPKTSYKVGESLSLDGIIVDATFTSGTITGIDFSDFYNDSIPLYGLYVFKFEHGGPNLSIFEFTDVGTLNHTEFHLVFAFDRASYGDNPIYLSYPSASGSVTVSLNNITYLQIIHQPLKVDYLHGDSIDLSGIILNKGYPEGIVRYPSIIYADNSSLTSDGFKWVYKSDTNGLTDSQIWALSNASTAVYGKGNIIILYKGTESGNNLIISSDEIEINVSSQVASLAIKTMPTKTTFRIREVLETSGLEINATYQNGTTQQITRFTTSPSNGYKFLSGSIGTFAVTVNYIENGVGVSTSFNVTVLDSIKLTSITVKTAPTLAIYKQGEAFDSTGLVITAHYSDSSTEDLTTGFSLNPSDGYVFTAEDKILASKSIGVAYTDYDDNITHAVSFVVSITTTATVTAVQTPITYTDEFGELDELDIKFITPTTLANGEPYINFPYLTEAYWNAATGLKVSIPETNYLKSGFEVPWVGYAVEMGNANNIVIGDNIMQNFIPLASANGQYITNSLKLRYIWVISTNPITEDNAEDLTLPQRSEAYVTTKFIATLANTCFITVTGNTISIAFKSSSTYWNDVLNSSTDNATQLVGKHIAIFAVQYGKLINQSVTTPTNIAHIKKQFLFGLNYIPSSTTATLSLTVNGWKLY